MKEPKEIVSLETRVEGGVDHLCPLNSQSILQGRDGEGGREGEEEDW